MCNDGSVQSNDVCLVVSNHTITHNLNVMCNDDFVPVSVRCLKNMRRPNEEVKRINLTKRGQTQDKKNKCLASKTRNIIKLIYVYYVFQIVR